MGTCAGLELQEAGLVLLETVLALLGVWLMWLEASLEFKFIKVKESKKEGKDQKTIQFSTTPDLGYQLESDNFTIRHHKREPRGQPFPSRRPQDIK